MFLLFGKVMFSEASVCPQGFGLPPDMSASWELPLVGSASRGVCIQGGGLCLVHPEGASNGSDICNFLKVSDLNGDLWNINFFPWKLFKQYSPVQWRYEGNIYMEKLLKYGHPNYVETLMDWIRMTQIFMDFSAIGNNAKKCTVIWVIM